MKRAMSVLVVVLLVAMAAAAGETKKCDGAGEDCLKKLTAKYQEMAWLGIAYDVDEDGRWVVSEVVPASPAAAAGFEVGDVLLAVDGEKYSKENKAALKALYASFEPGSQATYVVLRQDAKVKLTPTFGHVPPELQKKWIAKHMQEQHPEVKMASK